MSGVFSNARDLFGEVPPRVVRPMGRPRHKPTPAQRKRAAELHAAGLCQAEIASAMGLTPPTLRLHYAAEIGSRSSTGARLVERDNQRARP